MNDAPVVVLSAEMCLAAAVLLHVHGDALSKEEDADCIVDGSLEWTVVQLLIC